MRTSSVLVLSFAILLSSCQRTQTNVPRFGVVLSLTGPAAPYGQDNLKGLQLAQDSLRAEGYPVDLDVQDSAGDPAQAVALARRFSADSSILAILGPTRTGEAVAVSKILPELKIVMISVGSTGDWTGAAGQDFNQWTFRSTRVDTDLVRPLLTVARDKFGVKRVAAIYTANDDYSVSVMRLYEVALAELGMDLTAKESQMNGDTDRSVQLTKIKNTNPDALIVNTLSSDAPTIADQARRLGVRARFVGTAGFTNPATWKLAEPGTLDGTLIAENYYPNSPRAVVKAFTQQYKARFGNEAPPYAAYAYDGLKILASATRNAKSNDRSMVRDRVGHVSHFDGLLGDLTYRGKGDAKKVPVILQIRGSEYSLVQ
jgi:branched-chain amino acid transport system substrate-binding protein